MITGDSAYLLLPGAQNTFIFNIVGLDFEISSDVELAREQQLIGGSSLSGQIVTLSEGGPGYRPNQYSPVGYVPQALGMKIGMLLEASPYGVWQWGRAANLAFYLVICSLAIALLPRMRLFLVIFALIPSNIFCASSLMTNSTSFALAALLVAMTIRAIVANRRLSTPECLAFAAVAAAMAFVKVVYLPLFLPALLMPKLRENKRGLALAACVVTFAIVLYLAWSKSCGLEFVLPSLNYEANRTAFFGNLPMMLLWATSQTVALGSYFSALPLDYDLLMRLTLRLTGDASEVERLYRPMAFNAFVGNKDDHAKNFTFLYDEGNGRQDGHAEGDKGDGGGGFLRVRAGLFGVESLLVQTTFCLFRLQGKI